MHVMWVMEPISCYLLVGFNGQCPVKSAEEPSNGSGVRFRLIPYMDIFYCVTHLHDRITVTLIIWLEHNQTLSLTPDPDDQYSTPCQPSFINLHWWVVAGSDMSKNSSLKVFTKQSQTLSPDMLVFTLMTFRRPNGARRCWSDDEFTTMSWSGVLGIGQSPSLLIWKSMCSLSGFLVQMVRLEWV